MTQLAERLWQCRRDGGNAEVADNEAPKTLEEALVIQRAAVEFSGMTSVGFKVGSTSADKSDASMTLTEIDIVGIGGFVGGSRLCSVCRPCVGVNLDFLDSFWRVSLLRRSQSWGCL